MPRMPSYIWPRESIIFSSYRAHPDPFGTPKKHPSITTSQHDVLQGYIRFHLGQAMRSTLRDQDRQMLCS